MRAETIFRIIIAVIIPPLSVADKGLDKLGITTLLWFTTGFGGPLAAIYFLLDGSAYDNWRDKHFGERRKTETPPPAHKAKRPPARVLERADGEQLEIIDPDEDDDRYERLAL